MDIRPAEPDDIEAVAALWCDAFPGRRTPAERARMLETGGPYGGLESVLVARGTRGDLVAACKLYRLSQRITGAAMPAMGLAAVAVAPAARRQGLGARLCVRALEVAHERGDLISTLYPFRPDWYERLGWGLAGELRDHRFRTADLPRSDEARHVRAARLPDDLDAIAGCYARAVDAATGPIDRDARLWAWRLAGEELGVREPGDGTDVAGRVIVHDAGDGIAGYALLRRVAPRGDTTPSLHVRELMASTEAAYRGLLGWIAERAARWPVARHTARPSERFEDRLRDPRPPGARRARGLYFPTARIIRGPMLRLVDAPAALAGRRYFEAAPAAAPDRAVIEVRVTDPELPGNDGAWRLRIEGGVAAVSDAGDADARLEADAAALARIFAGALSPCDAARLGVARVAGDAAMLDAAFATREDFWLLDEF